jgi:hypothetical protein
MEAWAAWARAPMACHPIAEVRASPELIFDDPKKELRNFTVRLSAVAGTKRGSGRGSFVESVLTLVDIFYERIVQHIKPWTPPTPAVKTRQASDEPDTNRDEIAGELPLKSVQRASSTPDWTPPEACADSTEELEYTTNGPIQAQSDEGTADETELSVQSPERSDLLDSSHRQPLAHPFGRSAKKPNCADHGPVFAKSPDESRTCRERRRSGPACAAAAKAIRAMA